MKRRISIAARSNAIRTNYPREKIDNMQENRKCRLHGNRDETVNHIISEWGKLAQKEYKIRNDWVRKVIHWELCKIFKFYHITKCCTRNPKFFKQNETHKILSDFEMQTNHLTLARRTGLVLINTKEKFTI